KPDPVIFEKIVEEVGVKRENVVMIGDSFQDDVKAAKDFGMDAILVDRENDRVSYPDRVSSLTELKELL
ncbi:MAG: HAD family hydrolase, partial [Candidatus Aenigmatarchaeota archaeon]